jgi:hypothetical protein
MEKENFLRGFSERLWKPLNRDPRLSGEGLSLSEEADQPLVEDAAVLLVESCNCARTIRPFRRGRFMLTGA